MAIDTPLCVQDAPYNCVGNGTANDGTGFQLAINDAVAQGRSLYVPAGTYLMRGKTSGTKKLLSVDWTAVTGALLSVHIFGDGVNSSVLLWQDQIGTGNYALNVLGAGQSNFLVIENLSLVGKTSWNDPNGTLASTAEGYGLRLSNRIIVRNVGSSNFYAGFVINGDSAASNTDHMDNFGLIAQNNFYGVYVLGNTNQTRDWNFERGLFSQNQLAGIACADDGWLPDVSFIDCHFKNNPYAFHKNGSVTEFNFMDCVTFVRTKCETTGNWAIHGIGFDSDSLHNGGLINKLVGNLEIHGIEVDTGHTYCPILIHQVVCDGTGSDTSCVVTTQTAHGLSTGDHFAIAKLAGGDAPYNGAFIATSTTSTTITYRQTNPSHMTTLDTGRLGDIGGIRCGVLQQSYLVLSLQSDNSSTNTSPEQFWSAYQMDNDEFMVSDGDRLPSIRIRDSGQDGRDQSVRFAVGDVVAYLAKAAGSFGAGLQLEGSTNGNVVLSTAQVAPAGTPLPHAGTSLQPGATSESVAGNVATRIWAWAQTSGRNTNKTGAIGTGLVYTTNPGNNVVLMEDPSPSNHGNVMAWDKSATPRRIVGRSIANGSGGLINAVLHPAFIART